MADCISRLREYVERIVTHKALRKESNVGKVLILDAETTQVVANVFSQTNILNEEFYLVEQIGANHEAMPHLKAAVFVRPTQANVNTLARELENPQFKEYHLFFSNVLSENMLQHLAQADEHEVVKQVQEYYADVVAINEDLFTLNIHGDLRLSAPRASFTPDILSNLERTVQGICSVLLAMKMEPSHIRFQGASQVRVNYSAGGSRAFHSPSCSVNFPPFPFPWKDGTQGRR